MKTRKIPYRTCVVTKEKLPKQELIRVVRTPDGTVIVDTTGKANGRGAYLKKDKVLNRHLEVEVPESVFEALKALVK